jgi:hypothetical protein
MDKLLGSPGASPPEDSGEVEKQGDPAASRIEAEISDVSNRIRQRLKLT